jgi:hypothetical protein
MKAFEVEKETIASMLLNFPKSKRIDLEGIHKFVLSEVIGLYASDEQGLTLATVEAEVVGTQIVNSSRKNGKTSVTLVVIPGSDRSFS